MLKCGRSIVLYILLTIFEVHSRSKDPIHLLTKIVTRNTIKPLVVHVDTVNKQADIINLFVNNKVGYGKKYDLHDLLAEPSDDGLIDDYDGVALEDIARNTAKDIIYSFLRTSPDSDAELEDTKQILRQALRARCKTVTKCVTKCKIEKPSCPQNCQKIFDDLNLCDTPKVEKCNKPRCGKTMPPKWLL